MLVEDPGETQRFFLLILISVCSPYTTLCSADFYHNHVFLVYEQPGRIEDFAYNQQGCNPDIVGKRVGVVSKTNQIF